MMHSLKLMLAAVLATLALSLSAQAADSIGSQEFVDKASAAGIAEVEAGKLALEKGTHAKVKEFARMMVDDHKAAGEQLKALASKQKLAVNEFSELNQQAKAKILEMREAESFDRAYANNQVAAHEDAVALFKRAANSDDKPIRSFAKKMLPKLEKHLKLAQSLASEVGANE